MKEEARKKGREERERGGEQGERGRKRRREVGKGERVTDGR